MAAAPGSWVAGAELAAGDVTGGVAPAGLVPPDAGGGPPCPGPILPAPKAPAPEAARAADPAIATSHPRPAGREPGGVGLAGDHPVQQRDRGPLPERSLAGSGEGEDGAEAEDVAGRSDLAALGLFR